MTDHDPIDFTFDAPTSAPTPRPAPAVADHPVAEFYRLQSLVMAHARLPEEWTRAYLREWGQDDTGSHATIAARLRAFVEGGCP